MTNLAIYSSHTRDFLHSCTTCDLKYSDFYMPQQNLQGSSAVPSSSSASSSSDLPLHIAIGVGVVVRHVDVVVDVNEDETRVTGAGKSVVAVVIVVVVDGVDDADVVLDDKDTTSPREVGAVVVDEDECGGSVGCEVSGDCVVPAVLKVVLMTVVMVVVVVDALTEAGDVVSVVTTLSSSPPSPLMLQQEISSLAFLHIINLKTYPTKITERL
ncbi:hypothetical protein E2C01_077294 [Portunus trituberculatus]|uniref:Uncharacterized protein n=1 Tax=Portunus trituberculatus TaxID=210409 RepID=A0A5B7IL17_PORTR|nr:hypothetical protein [Portunus trituberculatus]